MRKSNCCLTHDVISKIKLPSNAFGTGLDIIKTGSMLYKGATQFPDDGWTSWLETEVGYSEHMANLLIKAAKICMALPSLKELDAEIAFALAELPDSEIAAFTTNFHFADKDLEEFFRTYCYEDDYPF
jgi:hypothetical protein